MNITWKTASDTEQKLFRVITILLGHNQNLLNFIFDSKAPKIRKRAGILNEDSWNLSNSDQVLIRAALDIWSGSGHVQLWELIENWDKKNWINCINALCELNGIGSQISTALEEQHEVP